MMNKSKLKKAHHADIEALCTKSTTTWLKHNVILKSRIGKDVAQWIVGETWFHWISQDLL